MKARILALTVALFSPPVARSVFAVFSAAFSAFSDATFVNVITTHTNDASSSFRHH